MEDVLRFPEGGDFTLGGGDFTIRTGGGAGLAGVRV